jgi:hypothetical protein
MIFVAGQSVRAYGPVGILSCSSVLKKLYNLMPEPYHIPVLLDEVIHYPTSKVDGVYVDCTFGGGGQHAAF